MSKLDKDETLDIEGRIENYFNKFNVEYIEKARLNITMIKQIIEKELEDYPREKMIFKESNKAIRINE